MSRFWTIAQAVAISWMISSLFQGFQPRSDEAPLKSSVKDETKSLSARPLCALGDAVSVSFNFDGASAGENLTVKLPLNRFEGELRTTLDLSLAVSQNSSVSASAVVWCNGRHTVKKLDILRFKAVKRSSKLMSDAETSLNDAVTQTYLSQAEFVCVADASIFNPIPAQLENHLNVDNGKYFPICSWNEFWVVESSFVPLNTSNALQNFTVVVSSASLMKFMLMTQLDQSFAMHENMGTMGRKELDEMKRIFLETNPWLLGLTFGVSMLHLLFEYLAFSNDVQFWKGRKNFTGLSVKSVLLSCYFSLVIFLYLLDGDSSWTVVAPSGVGVLLEFWKLKKTIVVSRSESGKMSVTFSKSYNSATKEHDDTAMKFLMFAMVPCLVAYTVYSAVYEDHSGWYSFAIGTQVRFIYFFGFAMMTPQIFINYKLKSVTHLPWRTFVYKALNTFIDDLFAFIIKMPTMHRLACFRDDIVFLILLYQRWIYPVDSSRTENEDVATPEKDDPNPLGVLEKKNN